MAQEKGDFSLTPNNEETISENLKVTKEFQTIYLSIKMMDIYMIIKGPEYVGVDKMCH